MKTCSKCKLNLSLDNFCKNSQQKSGLNPSCKKCSAIVAKKYRNRKRDELNEKQRQYRLNNLEEIRKKDNERSKCPKRKAYKNSRNRYYLVKERSLGKQFQKETQAIYEDCLHLSITTGEKFEVDHIIPIKGDNVCGLHVPWNLQILSQFRNRSKRNNI